MTNKISPETVTQYLLEHPDYIQNNIGLFLQPEPQAELDNGNLSLTNYQTELLYKKHQELHQQLLDIIEVGHLNEIAQRQSYQFILKVLEQKTLKSLLNFIKKEAKKIFKISQVELLIWAQSTLKEQEKIAIKRYLGDSSAYFGSINAEDVPLIFSEAVKTVAFVPLKYIDYGILAFATQDDYFAHEQSSEILLTFIAGVISQHLQNLNA